MNLDWTKCLHRTPKKLYFKGNRSLLNNLRPSIAIVGSRCMTRYGEQIIEALIPSLVGCNVTIVSGGAFGIDYYAQKVALEYNGKVITVLGSGINNPVPKTNINFFNEVEKKGLIISEYPDNHPATKYTFPERNRLISALADLVLVIEAREKSGSLITANFAVEQGKMVAAYPGRTIDPLSKGTNYLISQGAHIVTCPRDVIELLGITKKSIDPIQSTLDEIYY
jgi:DNA processing protein